MRFDQLTTITVVMLVFGFASTGSSQQSKSIKTYPKITTTYGGVFENVEILRVDVGSIYCRSQIGNCDIPLAHLPSEVLADLDSYISQAKAQAFQKSEDQRKRIEAEQKRIESERKRIEIEQEQIQAEQEREEAEQLRIYDEEQSRKPRVDQKETERANAESQIHDEEGKEASVSSADPLKGGTIIRNPIIKHILIITITGTLILGLLGRKRHHKRST